MRTFRPLLATLSVAATLSLPLSALHGMPRVSAPASSYPRIAGVYRLTIIGANGAPSQRIDIILEEGAEGTVGYLVNDASSAVLEDMRIEDGTLRATVMTTTGRGTIAVQLFTERLRGTLTVGKQVLGIQGIRAL
jgi:hypothetical protein